MKIKLVLVFINLLLVRTIDWSQAVDSIQTISKNKVSFVIIFDKNTETKDGYYINGYVVSIKRELSQELHLKKIKVTGNVTLVKSVKLKKPGENIKQGRYVDTKHILKPIIEIVN